MMIRGNNARGADRDFRVAFNGMADQAIITRSELAELLAVTDGSIRQMMYLGKTPPKAFPNERRACWFVKDVREWLEHRANQRERGEGGSPPKVGRPRKAVDIASVLGS